MEKTILIHVELIDSMKNILESKQKDGKMVSKSNLEWEKITSEFNANYDVNHKTCTQLKFLQKNMKSSIKSAVATDRREKATTRGGSQAYTELDSFQPANSSMLLQQIHSISNGFDDAVLHGDLDKAPFLDKKVSCEDNEINRILHLFFKQYQDDVSYS